MGIGHEKDRTEILEPETAPPESVFLKKQARLEWSSRATIREGETMLLAFGYKAGDRWVYRGFKLRCTTYGVELTGKNTPQALSVVFAHRARAEEAINAHLVNHSKGSNKCRPITSDRTE